MYLKQLKLANFRNYEVLVVDFDTKVTIIVGDNAQGKTNLVESINFLATLSSQRTSSDSELVLWDLERALVSGTVEKDSGSVQFLEVLINPGKGKTLKINTVKKNKVANFLGNLIVVAFSVDDLLLLRGSPKDRRGWIDSAICQIYPAYTSRMQNYNKLRQQKNALLKKFNGYSNNLSSIQLTMLDSWNEQLSVSGSNIIYLRQKFLKEIYPFAKQKNNEVSSFKDDLTIFYSSSIGIDFSSDNTNLMTVEEINEQYLKQIKQKTEEEIHKAQVIVGPHRDDILFFLNNREAHLYASQGQQRTVVLSLKLAEVDLIKQVFKEDPVLLLDDVLAELDITRQKFLFESVLKVNQAIITTTDIVSFKNTHFEDSKIIKVEQGKIIHE